MSKSKREKMKLKERRHQKKPEAANVAVEPDKTAPGGTAKPDKNALSAAAASEPPAPTSAAPVEAPKRRGRPRGSKAAVGGAGAEGTTAANSTAAPLAAADAKGASPPPRRGKAAALAARQAEEEALELQKLTAPHIQGCSPEWQQFYLKVRQAAVGGK